MALQTLARKIFGTQNDRELKSIAPIVDRINQLDINFTKKEQVPERMQGANFRPAR